MAQSTDALDRVDDPTLQIKSHAVPLRLYLRLVTALVSEARVWVGTRESAEYTSDEDLVGLHTSVVEPANVAQLAVSMPNGGGAMASWDVPESPDYHTLALDAESFQSTLGYARMAGQGVDDDGDSVVVRYDDDNGRRLETAITRADQRTQRVTLTNLLNPDAVRQSPDRMALSLPNTGHFESSGALRDAVAELRGTGDHVRVRSDPRATNGFQFGTDAVGDEHLSSDMVRFSTGYEGEADEAVSLVSLDYLADVATAIHEARMDKVAVHWGDEFPLVFEFFDEDYGIRGHYIIAPRIQTDDD